MIWNNRQSDGNVKAERSHNGCDTPVTAHAWLATSQWQSQYHLTACQDCTLRSTMDKLPYLALLLGIDIWCNIGSFSRCPLIHLLWIKEQQIEPVARTRLLSTYSFLPLESSHPNLATLIHCFQKTVFTIRSDEKETHIPVPVPRRSCTYTYIYIFIQYPQTSKYPSPSRITLGQTNNLGQSPSQISGKEYKHTSISPIIVEACNFTLFGLFYSPSLPLSLGCQINSLEFSFIFYFYFYFFFFSRLSIHFK